MGQVDDEVIRGEALPVGTSRHSGHQLAPGVGQAPHLPHGAQRAQQRAGDQRLAGRASGGRRYRSSSLMARLGSLNSWQQEFRP